MAIEGDNSDGNNNEFNRPDPIKVPKGWYTDVLELESEVYANVERLEGNITNDVEAFLEEKKSLVLSRDDIEVYFETSIINKQIAKAWKVFSPYFFAGLYATVPDSEAHYVDQIRWFLKWWLITRFKINLHDLSTLRAAYSLATDRAIANYFHTGDIEASYELMREECDRLGFVARENSNG